MKYATRVKMRMKTFRDEVFVVNKSVESLIFNIGF